MKEANEFSSRGAGFITSQRSRGSEEYGIEHWKFDIVSPIRTRGADINDRYETSRSIIVRD